MCSCAEAWSKQTQPATPCATGRLPCWPWPSKSVPTLPFTTSCTLALALGPGAGAACQALRPFRTSRQRLHFVSNMDGHELHEVLEDLNPQHTLFVVVSKSWSTAETLRNAQSAMAWFQAQGGTNMPAHFVAVTGKPERAQAMGCGAVLNLPDAIGGRFSLWSAVGLPVAIALGAEGSCRWCVVLSRWMRTLNTPPGQQPAGGAGPAGCVECQLP